jgi:nitrate reductase (cytochrome), electron transfer subunit
MRKLIAVLLSALIAATASAQDPESDRPAAPPAAYESLDPFRRDTPLHIEPAAAPMARVETDDRRRERGWPEQPPTIPHSIDGYQVDRNSNRCMLCHARTGAERFMAPMVSVTHFMDRDGQVLAQIAPRRYFCTQCHVVQTDADLAVGNDFVDVDTVLQQSRSE